MSEYINESLLDASPIRKQKEESAKLVAKWDKSGLLEGMENDWQRSGMACLLYTSPSPRDQRGSRMPSSA